MPERVLSVLDGNTFIAGDRLGDLRPDSWREHGLLGGHALGIAMGAARRRRAA
ncbi:MAG: hypothetical protein M3Y09_16000 [Actinomycetota bacterium]|nr:hypothetical protein [Actinomycetota bacterium]